MINDEVESWPSEWCEEVNECPVCSSECVAGNEDRLIDWLTMPPSGYWKMNICANCGVGYLSRRLKQAYIIKAYALYHTHTSRAGDTVGRRLGKIQEFLFRHYCAWLRREYSPYSMGVYVLARLIFPIGSYFDAKSRHIFQSTRRGRLLDIGCGNGKFLRLASSVGWSVVGIDFDYEAVSEARSGGMDVRHGGIESIDSNEKFDFISVSHVIEHVYDPVDLVTACYKLLKVGGALWLETPNINSMGYTLYQSNWRGLEPPRHIVLFNLNSLTELLSNTGFTSIRQKLHGLSGVYMGLSSERLLNRSDPCGSVAACCLRAARKPFRIVALEMAQLLSKERREYITLVATR